MSDVNENRDSIELKPKEDDWAKAITLKDIKEDVSSAKQYLDDQIEKVREWLDYFYIRGEVKPDKRTGKSQYVPRLIRKHFEWRCATLGSPFISSPDLFKTAPRTYADVEAARKNGLILNYQFNNQINKQAFIDNYIRTCGAEGTVIVKVGWETKHINRTFEKDMYDFVLAESQDELALAQQILEVYENNTAELNKPENDHYLEALNMSLLRLKEGKSGFYIPKLIGTEEVREKVQVKNQPTFEVCNIHDVTLDPSCKEDYTKARFIEHRFEATLEELEQKGIYQDLDDVDVDAATVEYKGDTNTQDGVRNKTFNFKDRKRKRILVNEYWRMHNAYDDDTLVPIVVTYIGDVCVRIEENPYPDGEFPFVVVPYIPVKNSPYGEPDAEFLRDNQTIAGALSRSILDTVGSVAAGQRGVMKNALDPVQWTKFKKGEDFLINPNTNPDQAIWNNRPAEVPQTAMMLLQSERTEGESFTGTKTYGNNGINGDALGSSVGGIQQAVGASALRDNEILSRLVAGIKAIGRKVIAMNQVFLDPIEHIRITDDTFEEINRDDLTGSIDIILSHSTAEEDNQKANELSYLLQTMGPNAPWEEKGPLLAKLADLRKMPDLAEFYRNYQPQPDPMQQELAQLEIEKKRKEIALLDYEMLEMESKAQLNSAKAAETGASADLKNLDYVETESGVKSERKKDEIRSQAESNMELELLKSQLNQQSNLSTTDTQ